MSSAVIPAQAGIHLGACQALQAWHTFWTPACAGMIHQLDRRQPAGRRCGAWLQRLPQGALELQRHGQARRGAGDLFNELEGRIWLLIVYAKAKFDNLPAQFLAQLKHELEHG